MSARPARREIVSALHQYAPGEVWPQKAVAERKAIIENTPPGRSPLKWTVVESIPVPDDIQREGAGAKRAIEVWIESMRAVAAEGIRTICYNVMPVVDWTRTDLDYPVPTGATALRFDYDRFAAFDLVVLKRKGAEADYDEGTRARARKVADALSQSEAELLTRNISAGLPGATTFSQNLDAFRERIASRIGGITPDEDARQRGGIPRKGHAGRRAARRAAHVCIRTIRRGRSSACRASLRPRADYEALFKAVPSQANGICFCVGSLGRRPDNDVVAMAHGFRAAHLFRASARDRDRRQRARASASPSPIISTAT